MAEANEQMPSGTAGSAAGEHPLQMAERIIQDLEKITGVAPEDAPEAGKAAQTTVKRSEQAAKRQKTVDMALNAALRKSSGQIGKG